MQYLFLMLSSIEILILAAIQGVFEFLPVSSTAHLVFISKYFEFNNQNILIDLCLHLGSLIAIVIYFRKDLFNFIQNKKFLIKILIATMPIIACGYIIYQSKLMNYLRDLEVIAWMSLIFGLFLYVSDKVKITKKIETSFTMRSAIIIGIFQIIALIPGVSRSGITITSGRLLGFNRYDAAKISFFLSIPALTAASFLGVYNVYKEGSPELNYLVIISIIFSSIFSYITISLFLNFIKKFSLNVFIIYRIIFSLFLLSAVYL